MLSADTFRLGAILLVLWVCGPCGPLLDRYFAERFPDHGHLHPVGYHVHGFQLAYTRLPSEAHRLALGPDGTIMAKLKAAGTPGLGLVRLLNVPAPLLPDRPRPLRVWPASEHRPNEAPISLPDPPPRPEPRRV